MSEHTKAQMTAAKIAQAYTQKVTPPTCGNCEHMIFDMALPAWMKKRPDIWFQDRFKEEINHRCGIGGFSVKKLGTCLQHSAIKGAIE